MSWTDEIICNIQLQDKVKKWIDSQLNLSVNELNQAFREKKFAGYTAKRDIKDSSKVMINGKSTCALTLDKITEITRVSIEDITEENIKDVIRSEILEMI